MRLAPRILGLPASTLLLITAHTTAAFYNDDSLAQRVNSASHNARNWADDPAGHRRRLEARNEQTPRGRNPIGVMKMSDDPGEKFYMEYWQYEEELQQSSPSDAAPATNLRIRDEEEETRLLVNASAPLPYSPPLALHTEDYAAYHDLEARGEIPSRDAAAALAILQKRQFMCPTGTSDCSSIGYPNSCCAAGETCFKIQDTGLGPVGCCPSGATCGGTITTCNSPNTPCSENASGNYEGGGCCIPNYVCAGIGCKL